MKGNKLGSVKKTVISLALEEETHDAQEKRGAWNEVKREKIKDKKKMV